MSYLGVDIGSRTVKYVVFSKGNIVKSQVMLGGVNPQEKLRRALAEEKPVKIVATGYGRHLAQSHFANHTITEIKAFALGVHYLYPQAKMVLDVGGQDTKVIVLSGAGAFDNFEINDRCAAGTGKFLEVMAHSFEVDINEFGHFALYADQAIKINSMCTVFAESEVVSLLTKGENPRSIALGIHQSIVNRIYTMINHVSLRQPIVFAGGGALNPCLIKLLEKKLEIKLIVPENPQILGALGAAIYASRKSGN